MHWKKFTDQDAQNLNAVMIPVRSATIVGLVEENKQPTLIPLVYLDATERPDFADLSRVISLEDMQRGQLPPYIYTMETPGLLMTLTLHDPVDLRAAFWVQWRGNEDFFQVMLQHERIYLTTVDDLTGMDLRRHCLGFTIFKAELNDAINLWEGNQ